MEQLGAIPEPGARLELEGYPVEIVKTVGNRVETVRIYPAVEETDEQNE
jgi:CBS domain containing-hemolysin-like protein